MPIENLHRPKSLITTDGEQTQNYLVTFRKFMQEFMELSARISEQDKEKISELKQRYLNATKESAKCIREKGFYDIAFAVACLGVYTLRVFTSSEVDVGMINLATRDILPNIKNLLTSRVDSCAREFDAKQLLLGNEHQAKVSKNSSDSSMQEWRNTLATAYSNAVVRG
jgi:hypothetical protein